ncbi:P-loop containing nucleoside triphosphate hydrolases superfamily protein [Artemisia annua]|uniref:P-loop containing nucleoside triphosphate hydrolases superfamily protein n=1 Tax=Artemisia annua TaxID=35608 RepID=A0A2U1N587_ARTAN|nr:P-loop containing nucleoside triphosphate hydrolases superfamily protein [Artemisia annua]
MEKKKDEEESTLNEGEVEINISHGLELQLKDVNGKLLVNSNFSGERNCEVKRLNESISHLVVEKEHVRIVKKTFVHKVHKSVPDKKEIRTREEDMEEKNEGGETAGKMRTLEGESDDEEVAPVEIVDGDMDVDEDVKGNKENGDVMVDGAHIGDIVTSLQNGYSMDEDDTNPLDAFMNSLLIPEITKIIPGKDSDLEYPNVDNDEDPLEDEDDDEFMKRVK